MENAIVPRWGRFERPFASAKTYENPFQEVALRVTFTSPDGGAQTVDGFWDGGATWRARFAPDQPGDWTYRTWCSDGENADLHGQSGAFICGAPAAGTRFDRHGPVRVAASRRHLEHADETPFLWLADTGWNGPLRSSSGEWDDYLRERVRQGFTAVQWVTTHWLASPSGDRDGRSAFSGHERIAVNPDFYQRLDARMGALNSAGLLAAPVLLWAAEWSDPAVNSQNPGYTLPEEQAIRLARYMVARWGAHQVVWVLNGDGDYRGPKAERWRRIGQAVFGDRPHAPVVLHPNGMNIPAAEFRDETWLDIVGYQSGHGDDGATLRWLCDGPPAHEWKLDPPRPLINLEPPYENHLGYQSRRPHSPFSVRRALYWSLLVAPTAGVTYGGHGVWGWDDGTRPPEAHPNTGIPLPWREALRMPAAEQIAHIAALFDTIDWWRLRPAPELLTSQPGAAQPERWVAASGTPEADLALIYVPEDREVELHTAGLHPNLAARWFNPRSGEYVAAIPAASGALRRYATPADGDWVLVLQAAKEPTRSPATAVSGHSAV
jgi:Protein of unknown function (DUF4038)/Domain of unknown function (DUF5060)/Putative collagen-binding domain of a collagenase